MIKSFIALTREIDDPKAAIADITAAVQSAGLLANSLGIISCFSEFEETGTLQAICEAMPFDCIGTTTCMCAANGEVDHIMLSMTVLTSDDCRFDTEVIKISEDYQNAVAGGIDALFSRSQDKPALLLSYFPLLNQISGDMILSAVDAATGGIPLFGTAAVDHKVDYSTAMTICNGKGYQDAAVFGAVYGNPEITYEIASLNERKIRNQKAVITGSNGNLLSGVNGLPALEYLGSIGLTEQELARGLGVVPLVVDHKDGTKPIARAVFGLTPDGHAICGGSMPEGATLGLGLIDAGDVVATTRETLKPLADKDCAILSYSCMARYLVLELDNEAEARQALEVSGEANFMFTVSGGEICPLPDQNGDLRNFYHNYTIVFCRIK